MHNIITILKFVNIQIIDIMMYVTIIFIYDPDLLKDIVVLIHRIVSSQDI